MNKNNKKVKIALITICLLLLATVIGLCIAFPTQAKQYANTAWDWLNKPLPVVGVSTIILGIFLIKLFAMTSLGKKQINEFKRAAANTAESVKVYIDYCNKVIQELRTKIEEMEEHDRERDEFIAKVVALVPNKKIHELGDLYYGEEEREKTIDNETKAN